ncbi:MAG: VOC family protein [Vulcanimicrobiaceae bacterium]
MITGMHAIIYSPQAERVQTFLRDVVHLRSVDAGEGWPIFAAPPTELAVHPTDGEAAHELFLMCDDVRATTAELAKHGVETTMAITDRGWGLVTQLRLPGGDVIGLYEPRHLSPL